MHNARRFLPAHLPLRVAHSAIEHSSQSPRFTSPQPANEFVRTAPRRTDKYAHKQQWRGAARRQLPCHEDVTATDALRMAMAMEMHMQMHRQHMPEGR